MKKSMVGLFFAAILIISCKSQNVEDKSTRLADASIIQTEVNLIADKPVKLTKQEFLDKVMDYEKNPTAWVYKGTLPCLIDFYADWCAPCRITSPILDELAKEYSGKISVYKIDVQVEKELAAVFGVQGIPAFLYCPVEGNPSMTSGIARTPEETKQMFIQNIEGFLLKSKTDNL